MQPRRTISPMAESTTDPSMINKQPASMGRTLLIIAIILLLVVAGFFAYRAWSGRQTSVNGSPAEFLSAEELAERHGLAVRLIGVTAAGGMIDFRLKILDADKAQQFLEDPANLLRLIVAESGEALMVSEGLDDDIEWEDGGILFNFYPNDNNVIRPGTPVIVEFGAQQLEPIEAQ